MKALWGAGGLLIGGGLLLVFTGAPGTMLQQVPLASQAVVGAYQQAAIVVDNRTRAWADDHQGVLVPWEEPLALEAALVQQDFGSIPASDLADRADARTWEFVGTRHEWHLHCPDDAALPCFDHLHTYFYRRTLAEVMAGHGLDDQTQQWVHRMADHADWLLEGP